VQRRYALAILASVVAGVTAPAAAASLDARSSGRFLAATNKLLTAAIGKSRSEAGAVNALIAHVASSCPGALPADLQNGTAAQRRTLTSLISEADFELVLAEVAPLRAMSVTWVRALGRLHWSEPAINRSMATEVRKDKVALTLRHPDLCTDAKASAVGGFTTLPPDAARFLKLAALANDPPAVIDLAEMVKPFITGDETRAFKQLRSLDARFNRLSPRFGVATARMMRALSGT
jgi:hypothetical protein